MRGAMSLASRAQCVQQDFDLHLEESLFHDLCASVGSSTRHRQRLGDSHSIVLESELIPTLAARLRTAPWAQVVAARSGDEQGGTLMALLLVSALLTEVRGVEVQPHSLVQQTIVRQVRCRRTRVAGT